MPYINIRVAGQLSDEQREQIVEEVTDTMLRVAGKPKAATYITIDEVPRTHWAKEGKLLES